MKELYNLSIKELIESIDKNISETKEVRKRLVIELNQEKDINRKIIKKELIEKYDENIFRYKMQKLGIEEMIKDHALYAYKKTSQEGQSITINIELDNKNKVAREEKFQEQPLSKEITKLYYNPTRIALKF